MVRAWTIQIIETDDAVMALIRNDLTGSTLAIEHQILDYSDRDEAYSQLFCGARPNIRDDFDQV